MSGAPSDPSGIFEDSDDYWRAVEFEGWPVVDPDPWRVSTPTNQPIMNGSADHE